MIGGVQRRLFDGAIRRGQQLLQPLQLLLQLPVVILQDLHPRLLLRGLLLQHVDLSLRPQVFVLAGQLEMLLLETPDHGFQVRATFDVHLP